MTVLADRFDGKRLNSPNDIVCAKDGSIWFTDPMFGILGQWEGEPAESETPMAVYRLPPDGGKLQRVIVDLNAPNGLAFSPDEKVLYVVESRATPHRKVWAYDVGAQGALANKRVFADANGPGAYDGIKVDVTGHVWCGFGSSIGALASTSSTGCACTARRARQWRRSTCPSAAPTCASAAPRTTGCSWQPATPCTRCTSTPTARSDSLTTQEDSRCRQSWPPRRW